MIMHMISGSSSRLNVKLEQELLTGISAAATASSKNIKKTQSISTIKIYRIIDACMITSGYNEDIISSLIGEMIFKSQLRNDAINFSAIGVGKWGSIRECHELEYMFVQHR